MPQHSCCEVRVMQMQDIFLLRTSAILPEAMSRVYHTPFLFSILYQYFALSFSRINVLVHFCENKHQMFIPMFVFLFYNIFHPDIS